MQEIQTNHTHWTEQPLIENGGFIFSFKKNITIPK